MVKNLPAVQETQVQSLGWEDPLEKRMATHSSILVQRISGQRSLAGTAVHGVTQSDITEHLSLHFTVIKTLWQWPKDRHIGQWNGTESPVINLHIYGQLINMKKTIWTLTLRYITRINSEWVKGLNLRAKTIELSEEKHEGNIHDVGLAAAAKSLPSCPTLCDPTDGSPPGAPVPGILQARTLEWVAISFSKA